MPKLFPSFDWKPIFAGMPAEARERSAFQSGTLQAGYFILAARAIGLDCGPMGGFDRDKVDAAFFPDGKSKVDPAREPRLWRLGQAPPAQSAARLRRGLPHRVRGACVAPPVGSGCAYLWFLAYSIPRVDLGDRPGRGSRAP